MKGDFTEASIESLAAILNVNSLTPALLLHIILPKMRKTKCGLVINVATVNVASPIPYNSMYTATKFFSYALSLSVGYENHAHGITFQTMLPGTTATPFHDKQNAHPAKSSLTMLPDEVAKGSLSNLNSHIYIPNRIDRLFFPFMSRLPIFFRMKLAHFILKKRLGVG
jgi:short-subunit dehydrogenase